MKIVEKDFEFRLPGTSVSGVVKAGTRLKYVDHAGYVVRDHKDAEFMSEHDWNHRYVVCPSHNITDAAE